MRLIRFSVYLGFCILASVSSFAEEIVETPQVDRDWWTVAGNPDLGSYTTDKQQPVDFGVWRTGDNPFSAEYPHVVKRGDLYYLFRIQRYGKIAQTSVYRSPNPLDFGVNDDRYFLCRLPIAAPEIVEHKGQEYIAVLRPELNGIQIARLKWVKK